MNRKKDPYNVTDLASPCDFSGDIKIIMLPMRDGVKLQTIVCFPVNVKKKAPVFLIRTPYSRTTELFYPAPEAHKRGVVTVFQACRGTGWSEGVFDPAEKETEKNDAEDLFKWLNEQEWYNGRCVMAGGSYPGWVQWCAMMAGENLLTAVSPHVAPLYGCIGSARPGGCASLSFTQHWMLSMYHRRKYGYSGVPDYAAMKISYSLPVIDSDKYAGYPEVSPFRKFLLTARKPWEGLFDYAEKFKNFTAPAYISGGWFDPFKPETVHSFMLMKRSAKTPEARNFSRLVIGPWEHSGLVNPDIFGKKCDYRHLNKWRERFLFNLLRSPDKDPLSAEPAVRYYMLCENKWHEADCWPPAGVKERRFYLHSSGCANGSAGDGVLSEEPPQNEPCDMYVSDPGNPVASNAGTHANLGCYDRSERQKRSDILVFTTPVMTEPLAFAGEVKLKFSAKISTPDTDFAATLTWVTPEGKALLLTTGMLRARFRNMAKEELLEPGKIYDFEIDLSHIAAKIMPGCALRLELCGQHFPAFDRNANSGKTLFEDTELFISKHTIYHDTKHPAVLILPCF